MHWVFLTTASPDGIDIDIGVDELAIARVDVDRVFNLLEACGDGYSIHTREDKDDMHHLKSGGVFCVHRFAYKTAFSHLIRWDLGMHANLWCLCPC